MPSASQHPDAWGVQEGQLVAVKRRHTPEENRFWDDWNFEMNRTVGTVGRSTTTSDGLVRVYFPASSGGPVSWSYPTFLLTPVSEHPVPRSWLEEN